MKKNQLDFSFLVCFLFVLWFLSCGVLILLLVLAFWGVGWLRVFFFGFLFVQFWVF